MAGREDIALDATITASFPGSAEEELARGTSLGRYVILDKLGIGGMGIVYAAYDPELDRRIALKLLRFGYDGNTPADQQARLLREAQAMARINHPNVIAVHDVGTFGERVFVAMELVEGVTLDAWLDEEQRAPAEIVATFVQAARGLAAAHAKGLVHRDFKPDNALLGGDGRVRVLDFGLAYAAETQAAPDATPSPATPPPSYASGSVPKPAGSGRLSDPITRAGALVGTPWYMSPEQLGGRRPDARSDQWSFCASLHEALFGQHPFALPDDVDVASLERRVRSGVRTEIPAARAARVPQRVRAALDRGLAADPGARFPTMDALVAELEPPPARGWRFGWVAAIVAALGAAGAAYAMRAKPGAVCEGAARELDGVWDAPRKGAVSAAFEATARSFAGEAFRATALALDSYASAWITMQRDACQATRVRGVQSEELLDLRTACLAERRAELKTLVDVLANADVDSVERAPSAARALSGLDACANVALLRAPEKLPSAAAKRQAIAAVRAKVAGARGLEEAGRYGDMLAAAKDAVTEADKVDYRPARAEARGILGRAESRAGAEKTSEASLRDAILDAEASHDDAASAEAWPALVFTQAKLFELDWADDSARHAGSALARIGGDPTREAELERARSLVERHRGHYDESIAHARAALAVTEHAFGATDPRVANALQDLSLVLILQSNYDEAIVLLGRAVTIAESAFGPDHPFLGSLFTTLSNVNEFKGDTDRALSYARRGLEIRERALGAMHPGIVGALIDLGNAEDDAGDFEATLTAYRRALDILERTGGPDASKADVLYNLAYISVPRHAYAEALAYSERALAIRERVEGPSHTDVALALETKASALTGMGRARESLPIHERALAILEAGFGKVHPDVAGALVNRGTSELALHEPAKAIPFLERAIDVFDHVEVPDRSRAEAWFALARALWQVGGDRARARALAEKARGAYAQCGKPCTDLQGEVGAWIRARPG